MTSTLLSRSHVRRTGEFSVDLPAAAAFPLFTPIGERLWAAGWDPVFHHPADGAAVEGAVFSTHAPDGMPTLWVLVDWQPEKQAVRYARVTPDLRAGTVAVQCQQESETSTRVRVTYDLTAVHEAGDRDLATWSEEWFADYLADWEREIASYLSRRKRDAADGHGTDSSAARD